MWIAIPSKKDLKSALKIKAIVQTKKLRPKNVKVTPRTNAGLVNPKNKESRASLPDIIIKKINWHTNKIVVNSSLMSSVKNSSLITDLAKNHFQISIKNNKIEKRSLKNKANLFSLSTKAWQ